MRPACWRCASWWKGGGAEGVTRNVVRNVALSSGITDVDLLAAVCVPAAGTCPCLSEELNGLSLFMLDDLHHHTWTRCPMVVPSATAQAVCVA